MRLFLCAGAARSGSTWLYNAARLLLLRAYPDLQAAWITDFDPDRQASAALVKLHGLHTDWAERPAIVLTCHRDLRDVVVSMRDMGWISSPAELVEHAATTREQHEFWSARAHLDLAYEAILSDPAGSVEAVSMACGLGAAPDAEKIATDLREMQPPRAYDRVTQLHPGHRTDGRAGRWREALQEDVAETITAESLGWLQRHGYEAA